jgi:hypothetical protein
MYKMFLFAAGCLLLHYIVDRSILFVSVYEKNQRHLLNMQWFHVKCQEIDFFEHMRQHTDVCTEALVFNANPMATDVVVSSLYETLKTDYGITGYMYEKIGQLQFITITAMILFFTTMSFNRMTQHIHTEALLPFTYSGGNLGDVNMYVGEPKHARVFAVFPCLGTTRV